MADNSNDKPRAVRSHDVMLDKEYVQWLHEIKQRFRSAQVKAAVRINSEQLLFNWQLGRDLVVRKAEEKWGSGIVEQVSQDLQAEFPNAKGFSARNLWNMKKWYLFYAKDERISEMLQSFDMLLSMLMTKNCNRLLQKFMKMQTRLKNGGRLFRKYRFRQASALSPGDTTASSLQNAKMLARLFSISAKLWNGD